MKYDDAELEALTQLYNQGYEKLYKEVPDLIEEIRIQRSRVNTLTTLLSNSMTVSARLRTALEFYAGRAADAGQRARDALGVW
jgi:hypothetical protein